MRHQRLREKLTTLLFLLPIALQAQGDATAWKSVDDVSLPEWRRVERADYTVCVCTDGKTWRDVHVEGALVTDYSIPGNREDTIGTKRLLMGYASFDAKRGARVRITRQGQPFKQVTIRPTTYKIPYQRVDERTIEVTLRRNDQRVSVEFDGDRFHNLFLIPNKPLRGKFSRKNGSHMRYYGKGQHQAGEIVLQTGDTLFIDDGAVVYGSVGAYGADHVVIMGRGTLCGSRNIHHIDYRQPLLYMHGCHDVQIEGVMFRGSPSWTMHLAQCENVRFDNVKNICWMRNSDGFDLCNCRNVSITNCLLRNFDDNLSLKNFAARPIGARNDNSIVNFTRTDFTTEGSGGEEHTAGARNDNSIVNFTRTDFTTEGSGGEEHTEHIRMNHCTLWADCAHNLLVGPESRGDLHMSDITFRDIQILEGKEKYRPYTGALAIMAADEGSFTDITFRDITIDHVTAAQPFCLDYCKYVSKGREVRNVTLRDIRVLGDKEYPRNTVYGRDADHPMQNITLQNITICGTRLTKENLTKLVDTNEFVEGLKVK
ncbi:MAG: hypothetical protein HUK03_08195 [Bacteroidaceae bacterium]|nr:hypothetical protein [Bacteroidaceae bacterium]